jgi:hypothetical protein
MSRVYTVQFAGVSVSAVQDLLTIFTGARAIKVHSVILGQITATAVGNLPISIKRLAATVTPGSGGTAPTPVPVSLNDAAATVTAHANDTGRTTTSGAVQTLIADVLNVVNGYLYLPPAEDRIVVGPGEALVVSLDAAPSGAAQFMSGTITFEEVF